MEFDQPSNRIIGSALEVHKTLGPGFLESIYHAALLHELRKGNLRADTQKEIRITYEDIDVGQHRLDLVVDDTVVVELKAASDFTDAHIAQVISYLKASKLRVGLLLNFGRTKLQVKRIVL